MKLSNSVVTAATVALACSGVAADLSKYHDFSKCSKIITRKEIHDDTPDEWTEWAETIRLLATTVEPVIDMARFPTSDLSGQFGAQHDLDINGGISNLTISEQVAGEGVT
ncbi:hypothetical protein BDK51DRAFT_48352 [Blyttiomyces helicus]|uniref:Uncharacterized protein n=1 Tax=Blyttiomyces helicus TaxID=388810 RepID=A0A4P9W1T4_9FUNG|nr:hypothetical protein BDK51DRAFT_48352 [Blyttiomyces helicus]|eukprot:RKO85123.1 hypothetical protein BDK51DRAFT_48352 [Blyttiomyces helicus]